MTATTAPVAREKKTIPGFAQLQRVGRSLMLPIASLPAAALLLRLGQPDMLGADGVAGTVGDWLLPVAAVLAAAGNALFANLPLIFALGVAVGYLLILVFAHFAVLGVLPLLMGFSAVRRGETLRWVAVVVGVAAFVLGAYLYFR